jgi:hypothetical protein
MTLVLELAELGLDAAAKSSKSINVGFESALYGLLSHL